MCTTPFSCIGPCTDRVQSRWSIKTQPRSGKRARSDGERRFQSSCELQGRGKSASKKATRDQSCQGADGEREGSERKQSGCARVEACAYTCSGLNDMAPDQDVLSHGCGLSVLDFIMELRDTVLLLKSDVQLRGLLGSSGMMLA